MLNRLFVVLIIIISVSFLPASDNEVETIAKGRAYAKVLQTVKNFHNKQHSEDKYSKLNSVVLIMKTKVNSYIEKWTIQTKSETLYSYKVVLLPGGDNLQGRVYNFSDTDSNPSEP